MDRLQCVRFVSVEYLDRVLSTVTTSGARSASISGSVVAVRITAAVTIQFAETGDGYLEKLGRLIEIASMQSNGEAMNFNNFGGGKPDCLLGNERCAFVY